jgi:hypothetical protein
MNQPKWGNDWQLEINSVQQKIFFSTKKIAKKRGERKREQ